MTLVRFGHFAIDWSIVYAAVRRHSKAIGPGLYVDLPEPATMVPMSAGEENDDKVWGMVSADPRFTTFDDSVAIDMSTVRVIMEASGGGESQVLFSLPSGRLATIRIHSLLAASILGWISKKDHGP